MEKVIDLKPINRLIGKVTDLKPINRLIGKSNRPKTQQSTNWKK